jgi:hypothetical protein
MGKLDLSFLTSLSAVFFNRPADLCLPDCVNRGYTTSLAHLWFVWSIGVGIRRTSEQDQASCT